MTTTGRWVAAAALLGVLAGGATASGGKRPAAPVPPTQEIEVLDPGVDPTGKPAVVLRPGPAGTQLVDVPPAVLVHRYYYTGDRTFQGPMLPGGPVIVVVNHPKCGERVYVPVTMPPGAPKVTYRDDSIRYDYGPQSVTLKFGLLGKPRVVYTQSTALGERVREVFAEVCDLPETLRAKLKGGEAKPPARK